MTTDTLSVLQIVSHSSMHTGHCTHDTHDKKLSLALSLTRDCDSVCLSLSRHDTIKGLAMSMCILNRNVFVSCFEGRNV